jgi:hypothetical protein
MHIVFRIHLDVFVIDIVHPTLSEDEGGFVHHFTSSFNPRTRSNVSEMNIAYVNRGGVFCMHIAFKTHLDVFVIDIDIVYATS